MINEIGHFTLILAFTLALVQGIVPLLGAYQHNNRWMLLAIPVARLQFSFLLIAFICLSYAFASNDFSVLYVAQNSNSALPWYYRLSAVWGAHEGSLLLWALILAAWTVAVTFFSRRLPTEFVARVLAILGLISVGFLLFMLATSNPFERLIPPAPEGRDLNPLLQDFGLIVHPPMLYMGYVGLAVPFAFAVAGLLEGKLDAAWTRWVRPWTTVAWIFLTLGIALGSWWAYYELGWGGWWFWDPVENASFMPWLVATALIHSLAVTEQRNAFKAWTVLLAIFGFSLSLLGTFLVRSGVLVSVHAFATDPSRGVFILAFLAIVIGSALFLYAWRANNVSEGGQFDLVSRETLLLFNNVFLVLASGTILLATLYPIMYSALGLGAISIGKPYYDKMFLWMMLPLILILGLGPLMRWKRELFSDIFKRTIGTFIFSIALAFLLATVAAGSVALMASLGLAMACWVAFSTVQNVLQRLRHKANKLDALLQLPRAFIGMTLAHIGVAVFIVGVTMVNSFEIEKDVRLAPGEEYSIQQYRFVFNGVSDVQGPNYRAQRGEIDVFVDNHKVASLHPEKRVYPTQGNPMTEAGIDAGFTRDIYVALGEPLGNEGAWALRLYYKPFVRWIWLGALLMALGGIFSASDKRYRRTSDSASTKAEVAT